MIVEDTKYLPSLIEDLEGSIALWERSSQKYYAAGMQAAEKEIITTVINHASTIISALKKSNTNQPEQELLIVIARSIGRTTKTTNFMERAKDVLRSVVENNLELPQTNGK